MQEQTNKLYSSPKESYISSFHLMLKSKHRHMVFISFVCFGLLLHKLAFNKPGENWGVTKVSVNSLFLVTRG